MQTTKDMLNKLKNSNEEGEMKKDTTTATTNSRGDGAETLNVDDRVFTNDPAVLESSRPSSHMGKLGKVDEQLQK
ncbi:hypothetical protein E3P77_00450 [Wallemia ichthyophaga]|uniref:Uncharacterized protein n=2 Tax=Wallemia ichthyophaga TaxID=245174 RepID=A0A4T0GV93_WALIC|nr:uncharacterized protein J056_000348 [Wallemia ichthyophaga EXF-994]TIA75382.1 hypothetical protein E3P91_00553 [Wallemia ichthyophaga]EOR04984.1 hypothetical protein J056_000348 [Wallemia ichthyophaga EXF-994]TIA84094.1 hypothetical protein E3P98_00419 [Wallemia ichthyophaga]TIA93473.1 hypothetical protein E3P97_00969 [Wallemia ichthyophaga]TIA97078.1 hypothetical protein E3P95_03009 [Wallemia ichthyophaga]